VSVTELERLRGQLVAALAECDRATAALRINGANATTAEMQLMKSRETAALESVLVLTKKVEKAEAKR
jgi:hypothetical protein